MARKTRFSNRKSLDKILKKMPVQVKIEAARELDKGAERMMATARLLVPKVSRDLENTIRKEDVTNKFRLGVQIKAGNRRVPYARIIEFRPGSAFFWPAYRANRRAMRAGVTRGVTRGIKKVVARNRKGR